MKKLALLIFIIFFIPQFVTAQNVNTRKYCKKIEVEKDKFSDETKYRTPLMKQISFTKIVEGGEEVVYMRLSTVGSTASTGNGVTLLLEDGSKIEKNVDTSVDVNSNAQFVHTAFFRLDQNEIELIKNHNITDVRLYIFDMRIRKPIQYRAFMICLDEMT